MHTEPVIQLIRKVKEYGSDLGPQSPLFAKHIPQYGSRLLHGHENLWKTTWRSYGRFECEMGIWGMFMNTTRQAAVHLGKDYDMILRFIKN